MTTIRRINTLLLVIISIFFLCSCEGDNMLNEYQKLNDKNHIFKVSTPSEIFELLNKDEKAIIVFSFPECPWCQEAIPYINEIAKEQDYNVVYYLNILEIRESKTDEYNAIYERIRYDIGNPDKINAPTVIVINNSKVLGYHIDTVESHVKNENNVLLPMTLEQAEELRNIYRELFRLN